MPIFKRDLIGTPNSMIIDGTTVGDYFIDGQEPGYYGAMVVMAGVVRVLSVNATSPPTISIGDNAPDYDNIQAPVVMAMLDEDEKGKLWFFDESRVKKNDIYLRVVVPAVADVYYMKAALDLARIP